MSVPEASGSLSEITDLIRATRARITELDDELPSLVREAFCEGNSWRDIAGLLGVSKARVYQLRADGRANQAKS
ncbi:hypothetical protein AWB98_29430 [Mycolicibacterium conceptionense]|uniref:RNA polymerase sigma factor 70 region 4 type 2 domain-containing protein n=1 Tax=Mycolicibacterium conceptionense TaxID=451644 RepID=A0ABX3UYI9_9MYCO|nr:hypothetical protein AWB98_29430 [Mycolicibacterium conceptionense]